MASSNKIIALSLIFMLTAPGFFVEAHLGMLGGGRQGNKALDLLLVTGLLAMLLKHPSPKHMPMMMSYDYGGGHAMMGGYGQGGGQAMMGGYGQGMMGYDNGYGQSAYEMRRSMYGGESVFIPHYHHYHW